MGDLVLRDEEIEPVMAKLAGGGLEVTAFHHHVLHETPRVYYVHIHGAGEAVALAQAVRAAVDLTHTSPPAAGTARRPPVRSALTRRVSLRSLATPAKSTAASIK